LGSQTPCQYYREASGPPALSCDFLAVRKVTWICHCRALSRSLTRYQPSNNTPQLGLQYLKPGQKGKNVSGQATASGASRPNTGKDVVDLGSLRCICSHVHLIALYNVFHWWQNSMLLCASRIHSLLRVFIINDEIQLYSAVISSCSVVRQLGHLHDRFVITVITGHRLPKRDTTLQATEILS